MIKMIIDLVIDTYKTIGRIHVLCVVQFVHHTE